MTIAHVEDHEELALARLPEQDKGKENFAAVLGGLVAPVQEVEDALWQLLTERGVDNAIGVVLDAIGKLVGQPRNGMEDDDYRRFVRARISVNKSNGTVADLILVATLVLDDDAVTLIITPSYPAGVGMIIYGSAISDAVAATLASFLRKTVAAGVRLLIEFATADPADTFAFLDDPIGLGLGDATDPDVGGIFASVTE